MKANLEELKMRQSVRPARAAANRLSGGALAVALALALALAPAAVAAQEPVPRTGSEDNSLGGAISQPLRDLSLMRAHPDELLVAARAAPYAEPAARECPALDADIAALDAALGPDVDMPPDKAHPVGALAAGAVRSAVGLPFRGVVRRLSGAEKRDRQMREAILAGMVRRSYLKGVRSGMGCAQPLVAEQAAAEPAG